MYHIYKPVASFPARSMHLNKASFIKLCGKGHDDYFYSGTSI